MLHEDNILKLKEIINILQTQFSNNICCDYSLVFGELTVTVNKDHILKVLSFLRDNKNLKFVSLLDICGVDYPDRKERFDLCYHLLSPYKNTRIRIKLTTDETVPVASACAIYPGAEWYEREAYDMYGILFSGHPDLRRILSDYGFQGHPLRKDFPVTGFVECRYDYEEGKIVYEPVVLRQEMRQFDNMSPWESMDLPLRETDEASSAKIEVK
ncbi:NADH-quinone oxidoreductase subunit C [Bartonella sp. DGB1]|uniref:NADH-quinone oxidoreductase subunit C n=1 Tax=Bartonella sp. DGB1 TaxID=3239807 RepID=UPI003524DC8C